MVEERRTTELEQRIEDLERRLARSEGRAAGGPGVEPAFWALMHRLFPDEARKHIKAAGREQLLAARVYLDHWIARTDAEESDEPTRRRETIEVE
jgi:hypothetical protein